MSYIIGRGRTARETYPQPQGAGVGPQGPQGPQGPTGATGAAGALAQYLDSGTIGLTLMGGGDLFARKDDAGGLPIECDFTGNWTPGDVLVASFTASLFQFPGPGASCVFTIAVSLDNRATWQSLTPTAGSINTPDTSTTNSTGAGSGAIALATAPIVRVFTQTFVTWGANLPGGVHLLCARTPASVWLAPPSGTLV